VRLRSVIHALSSELFGTSLVISDFPSRPDLVGIGMTDWDGYAIPLTKKLSYTNTYYHQEPFLDITSADPSQYGRYDFVISSDVYEHISPPISKAFENARRLLKPNGVMIFSVPYVEGETKEHFPELHQFCLQKKEDGWVVLNQTSDGRSQEFSDLTFHGGPGTVLEMRLFGKDGLLRNFKEAGFVSAQPYNQDCLKYGIIWLPYIAEKAPYRPLIYGLDTPPWALRSGSASAE
jgi:SAM-dependent methyltransferase